MEVIAARGRGSIPVDSRHPMPVLVIGKVLHIREGHGGKGGRGRLVVRSAGGISRFRDLVRLMLEGDQGEGTVRAPSCAMPGVELERHHVPA